MNFFLKRKKKLFNEFIMRVKKLIIFNYENEEMKNGDHKKRF